MNRTTTPANTPAEPAPEMTLPPIKAPDVGAAPQRADPISKRTIATMNTTLVL
jgi:hypothetical protein